MGTYIGQLKLNNGDTVPIGSTLYGTCDTAAGTAAKVATVTGFDKLITGVTIHVKFTNSNSSSNPTLAIKPSSSGTATTAKSIKKCGTTAPGTSAATSWQAGSVLSLTYDGTYWQMNNHLDDTVIVSGVKGNANSNYKTGNVNLTPADIGALSLNGGTMDYSNGADLIIKTTEGTAYDNHLIIFSSGITMVDYSNSSSTYNADLAYNYSISSIELMNRNSDTYSNSIRLLANDGYNNGADIRREGSDSSKWVGISQSLNETLTKMWNTKGAWAYTTRLTSNLAVTTRTAVNSALNQTITAHGGVFFFYFFGVIQTSKNTTTLKISVDGTLASPIANTNSKTPIKVDGVHVVTLSAGTHTIKLEIVPQDSTTTGTVLAYNTIGWAAIEV